ncbi:hypothetical protein BDV33DRAFT_184336 [Aspergillus novoparasiticus]|uniref:Uncharacterized protein n=1 Tax=Aspergillus novoparasiticus TaxID=986946 RepID=A0A5N6E7U7_9EURO|nr:hypothetical protein BDV33DRAFT_184336 [Aspergillus novoparasiticus]
MKMSTLRSEPEDECLGIVVDHRLRALFKPIYKQPRLNIDEKHSLYLATLAQTSTHRDITEPEINVTQQFFGPRFIGGITVILIQPSNFHPYWEGFDSVIQNCRTHSFLDEGFRAVTCGSIGLGNGVLSIIDSAPYTRPNDKVSAEYKKDMRRCASGIIREKKPDVVLCMWKDTDGVPLRMAKVRSVGVGKDFAHSKISFSGVPLDRVNSFHPSFAANHNPHISCFQQLFLLNIAEACYRYEHGSWREEEWMEDLKKRCRQEAKLASATEKRFVTFFFINEKKNCMSPDTYDYV